jgi:hypothetical protein
VLDTLQGLGLLTAVEIVGPIVPALATISLATIYGVYHSVLAARPPAAAAGRNCVRKIRSDFDCANRAQCQ